MTRQLTFLHAADLHLGAPFRGLRALSEQWADRLLRAIPEAYARLVDVAIEREVDFVVIAGDIFDTARPSYADYRCFFDGLTRLDAAGIPVYLCTGNHDPYTSWQHDLFALPGNVTMLPADKPGFALFERRPRGADAPDAPEPDDAPATAPEPLCVICGRGYYNQTWPIDEDIAAGLTRAAAEQELGPLAREAPFGVGVLHTGLDLDRTKAPTDPTRLLQAGLDYWALGHIHHRYAFPSETDDPRLAFSGCIQGRDIKETGERGAYLVTLTEGAPNRLEFVPTAAVVWQRLSVDVSDCPNLPELCDRVIRELFRVNGRARCEEMCTRITLTGATPLHDVLARPGVVDDLRAQINDAYPEFFCDALIDGTTRPIDKKALAREGLFPAVFLQAAASQRADETAEVAFLQDEFLRRNTPLPRALASNVGKLSREAEDMVLDLLGGGEVQ